MIIESPEIFWQKLYLPLPLAVIGYILHNYFLIKVNNDIIEGIYDKL